MNTNDLNQLYKVLNRALERLVLVRTTDLLDKDEVESSVLAALDIVEEELKHAQEINERY